MNKGYVFHGGKSVTIINEDIDHTITEYDVSRMVWRDMCDVRAALIRAGYDNVNIPIAKATKDSGLAFGGITVYREVAITRDNKTRRESVPAAFITINNGNIFPTRFKCEYVYDSNGRHKVDADGNPIRVKRGINNWFNKQLKTPLARTICGTNAFGKYTCKVDYRIAVE